MPTLRFQGPAAERGRLPGAQGLSGTLGESLLQFPSLLLLLLKGLYEACTCIQDASLPCVLLTTRCKPPAVGQAHKLWRNSSHAMERAGVSVQPSAGPARAVGGGRPSLA